MEIHTVKMPNYFVIVIDRSYVKVKKKPKVQSFTDAIESSVNVLGSFVYSE